MLAMPVVFVMATTSALMVPIVTRWAAVFGYASTDVTAMQIVGPLEAVVATRASAIVNVRVIVGKDLLVTPRRGISGPVRKPGCLNHAQTSKSAAHLRVVPFVSQKAMASVGLANHVTLSIDAAMG